MTTTQHPATQPAAAQPVRRPATVAARRRSAPAGLLRVLPAVTLVAVLTITASAEFQLARTVLDLPPHIAWALPVAVDSYVLAAMRSGRDVLPAMSVMAGALAASMGAHLSAEGKAGQQLPGHVVAPAATAIMVVLVVVAWRVHVLIEHPAVPYSGPDPAEAHPAQPVHPATDTAEAMAPVASTPADPLAASTGVRLTAPTPSYPAAERSRSRALARPAPEPQPATTTAPRPAEEPAAASPAVSDAEILTAITANPLSIRALKRAYGIGQARATRLHAAASQNRTTTQPTDQNSQQNDQNDNRENASMNNQRITSTEVISSTTEQNQESRPIKNRRAERNTHTCITDRVGPPSPAGPVSGVESQADPGPDSGHDDLENPGHSRGILHAVREA